MLYLKAGIDRPLRFLSAGSFTADEAWTHTQRVIDSIEIIIGTKGSVFIQQEDEKAVISEGDVMLLFPGRIHKGYAPSAKGASFYWVHFKWDEHCCILDEKSAAEEIYQAGNNPYFSGLNGMVLLPARFHASSTERVGILSRQLLHINESRYYTGLGVDYLLTSLLIELGEQVIAQSASGKSHGNPPGNLTRITEWIRVHLSRNISLRHVAYEFNYTREYLARYFKKHMGMSMQEYINNMKMAKARELLSRADLSVKEIASALGFQDDKYFLKLFKRYEKITPREYRNAYYRIHLNNK